MTADISDEEAQLKLQQLLQEFDSIFDPNDKSPAKTPVIDIPLKPEFKNKVFSVQSHYVHRKTKK